MTAWNSIWSRLPNQLLKHRANFGLHSCSFQHLSQYIQYYRQALIEALLVVLLEIATALNLLDDVLVQVCLTGLCRLLFSCI